MSAVYQAKLNELQKYVPTLDAWVERLRHEQKYGDIPAIEQMKEHLTSNNKTFCLESLLRCEPLLATLQSRLCGVDDPQHENPKENRNWDNSREKLRSLGITPGQKVETSRFVNPSLFVRRSQLVGATRRNTESSAKKPFSLAHESLDHLNTTKESQLYERRPPREERNHMSPRYRYESTSSHSYDSGTYNNIVDIDLNSFNLCNSDDVMERIFYGKDSDTDILQLRLARAKIIDELSEIIPEYEIPNLMMKRFKEKSKKKQTMLEVEDGELTDVENEAFDLDVLFDNKDFNDYHEFRSCKPHRQKIRVNIILSNSGEKTADSGANEDCSEIAPSKKNEKQDTTNQSLFKDDLYNNASNGFDKKVQSKTSAIAATNFIKINIDNKKSDKYKSSIQNETKSKEQNAGEKKIPEKIIIKRSDVTSSVREMREPKILKEVKDRIRILESHREKRISINYKQKTDRDEHLCNPATRPREEVIMKVTKEKNYEHQFNGKAKNFKQDNKNPHQNKSIVPYQAKELNSEKKSSNMKKIEDLKSDVKKKTHGEKSDKYDEDKQKVVDVSETVQKDEYKIKNTPGSKNINKNESSQVYKAKEVLTLNSETDSANHQIRSEPSDDNKRKNQIYKHNKLSDLIKSMTLDKKENLISNPCSLDQVSKSKNFQGLSHKIDIDQVSSSKEFRGVSNKTDTDETKSSESVPKDKNPTECDKVCCELLRESQNRQGIAPERAKTAGAYSKIWENVENRMSYLHRSESVALQSSSNDSRNLECRISSSNADRVRIVKELGQHENNHGKHFRSTSNDFKPQKMTMPAPSSQGKWLHDVANYDDKHASKNSNKDDWSRKNYNDDNSSFERSHSSIERTRMKKSRWGKPLSPKPQQGIVYSDDNIARGKRISPSIAVKSYKIPKFRRTEEPMEAGKSPCYTYERKILQKSSDSGHNFTPKTIFVSEENKTIHSKSSAKLKKRQISQRRKENDVSKMLLINQENNAIYESSKTMAKDDTEVVSKYLKINNDLIQDLSGESKPQSNKVISPTDHKQFFSKKSLTSFKKNDTEPSLRKYKEAKIYDALDIANVISKYKTLKANKEFNYAPFREFEVLDSFDSFSEIADDKINLQIRKITDSLNDSPGGEDYQQSYAVQSLANIELSTFRQTNFTNENVVAFKNSNTVLERVQTTVFTKAKYNEESKSSSKTGNIQDEEEITSSSKDDEINEISSTKLIEPKNYVSNIEIFEENAPDNEAFICRNVPDSTYMAELPQSTENKNFGSPKQDDSNSLANGDDASDYCDNTKKVDNAVRKKALNELKQQIKPVFVVMERIKLTECIKPRRKPRPKPEKNIERIETVVVKRKNKMQANLMTNKINCNDLSTSQKAKKATSPPLLRMPRNFDKLLDAVDKSKECLINCGQKENNTSNFLTDLKKNNKQNEATTSRCERCYCERDTEVYHLKSKTDSSSDKRKIDHNERVIYDDEIVRGQKAQKSVQKIIFETQEQNYIDNGPNNYIQDVNDQLEQPELVQQAIEIQQIEKLLPMTVQKIIFEEGQEPNYIDNGKSKDEQEANDQFEQPEIEQQTEEIQQIEKHLQKSVKNIIFEEGQRQNYIDDGTSNDEQEVNDQIEQPQLVEQTKEIKQIEEILPKSVQKIIFEESQEQNCIDNGTNNDEQEAIDQIKQPEEAEQTKEIKQKEEILPKSVQNIIFEGQGQNYIDNGTTNDEQEANDQSEETEVVEQTEEIHQIEEIDCLEKAVQKKTLLFEIVSRDDGSNLYFCKIGSCEFSTALQISFKKHVQIKHAAVVWDGTCQFCDFKADSCSYADYANHFAIEHLKPLNIQEKENDEGISKHLNPIQSLEETDNIETSNPILINDPLLYANHFVIEHLEPFNFQEKENDEGLSKDLNPIQSPEETDKIDTSNPILINDPSTSMNLPNNDFDWCVPVIDSVVSLNVDTSPPLDNNSVLDTLVENSSNTDVHRNITFPPTEETSIILSPIAIYKEKAVTVTSTMTTSKMAQIFKCAGRYCSFTSTTSGPFVQHIQNHLAIPKRDNGDVIRCVYCTFTSTEAHALAHHIFDKHGYCGYGCIQCFFVSVSATLITHHYVKEHPHIDSILKMHEVNDNRELSVRGMLSKTEAEPEYACLIDGCEFRTRTASLVEKHLLSESHPNFGKYRCRECVGASEGVNLPCRNPKQLITHLKSHGYTLYQCTFCPFVTTHDTDFLTHYLTYHPNRKLQVHLCRVVADSADNRSPKRITAPLINLEDRTEILKVVNGPEESPKHEVERSLKLENSFRDVKYEIKTEPETKREPFVEESDIIALYSDDETIHEDFIEVAPLALKDEDKYQAKKNVLVPEEDLYTCGKCKEIFNNYKYLRTHLRKCYIGVEPYECSHCSLYFASYSPLIKHMEGTHKQQKIYRCGFSGFEDSKSKKVVAHVTNKHRAVGVTMAPDYKSSTSQVQVVKVVGKGVKILTRGKIFGPDDIDSLPTKIIFDDLIHCSCGKFTSRIRETMIRHLKQHRNEPPTSSAAVAPVNPVNEIHFDRMTNLASSSLTNSIVRQTRPALTESELSRYPRFIEPRERLACGVAGCVYISTDEETLRHHWDALHAYTAAAALYMCVHCSPTQTLDKSKPLTGSCLVDHLRMHDEPLYACSSDTACTYYHHQKHLVEKHVNEKHGGRASVFALRKPKLVPLDRWSELQEKFGPSCQPQNGLFACPRCTMQSEDRELIENHLMTELDIFQWSCSGCTQMFPYYQPAREHASTHTNLPRPLSRVSIELKKEWIRYAVEYQAVIMKTAEPVEESLHNELLVIRSVREINTPDFIFDPTMVEIGVNDVFYSYICDRCAAVFPTESDFKSHSEQAHPGMALAPSKSVEPPKKKMKWTARKSTSKLPSIAMTARKSTTKLPSTIFTARKSTTGLRRPYMSAGRVLPRRVHHVVGK